jgi:phage gp45-like
MAANLKYGFLESSDDSGALRSGTASWLGREGQPIQLASLYGLVHNPPAGCQVLLLPQNGQESNSIGLPDLPTARPLKDLLAGEVAVVNYLTGAYVLFKENGDIEVVTPSNLVATVAGNITMTAPQINLNGVIIDASGNITTPGIVTADDFIET